MRTKDAKTNKLCWKLNVSCDGQLIKMGKYSTLQQIASELGMSYSQVSELTPNGRKKNNLLGCGKYAVKVDIERLYSNDSESEFSETPNYSLTPSPSLDNLCSVDSNSIVHTTSL
tara:strand:- start:4073 stop:4417 length:345 start_codon:yes stop_codon:yes gene_type:complete